MNPDKNNTYEFLVEYITAKVVEQIMKDSHLSLEDALLRFHNSETFEKLYQKDTEMYIESPAYVYDIFLHEMRSGTIRGLNE